MSNEKETDQFKSATTACMKAIGGHSQLSASYGGSIGALEAGSRIFNQDTARLPTLESLDPASRNLVRGAADSAAMYHHFHNPQHHHQNLKNYAGQEQTLELLEKVRCEALGVADFPGSKINISYALEEACKKRGYNEQSSSDDVSMAEGLALLLSQKMNGIPLMPTSKAAAETWKPWFEKRFPDKAIDELKALTKDQDLYSRRLQQMLQGLDQNAPQSEEDAKDQEASEQDDARAPSVDEDNGDTQADEHDGQADDEGDSDVKDQGEASDQAETGAFDDEESLGGETAQEQLLKSPDGTPLDALPSQNSPIPEANDWRTRDYPIFTTEFDEQIHAGDLASNEELAALRHRLDRQLQPFQTLTSKMAHRLQRLLMARQARKWLFNVDEGILNTSHLATVITDQNTPLSYKQEVDTDFRDTVVSLLIDNSGSMRGRPIMIAALSTDIMSRTLEQCGIKVEILGFTTKSWKGGKSREQWVKAGRPEYPGRLNDLRHIIYKSADVPWRRSHNNIGLMLKEGILKENIDGEALIWAVRRLQKRPEQRRILMVISDGAPVDDSTLSANSANFLENDLKTVISKIESLPGIDICAIGIGHDVTRYYSQAITIRDVDELGVVMVDQLTTLFQKRRKRSTAS